MSTGDSVKRGRLSPTALTPTDLAALLTKAGGVRVKPDDIAADLNAGAPTNADGTINLVHYAAWLVRDLATGSARGE